LKFDSGDNFFRAIGVLAGSTAAAQVLTIAASPVLTRLYTPTDFGILAFYSSVLSMITVIAALCYEIAIPLPEDEETAANLLGLALITILVVSIATGLFIFLGGDRLVSIVRGGYEDTYLRLLPISVLGVGTYQALVYWALRKKNYAVVAKTNLVQSMMQVSTQVCGGLLHLGSLGLIIGDTLGRASGGTFIARLAWKQSANDFKLITCAGIWKAAKKYKTFPLVSSWASLLNTIGRQITPILLTSLYGVETAGLFLIGQKMIGLPSTLVSRAVSQAYIAEASCLHRTASLRELKKLFLRISGNLFRWGLLPIGILAIIGPNVFEFIFGAKWVLAGEYVRYIAPMILLQFIVTPLSQTLIMMEKQMLQGIWDLCRVILVFLGFYVSYIYDLQASTAIMIYGVVMSVMYGVLFYLSLQVLSEGNETRL
jgi:O-antigen/teichoic acid export membrane protein